MCHCVGRQTCRADVIIGESKNEFSKLLRSRRPDNYKFIPHPELNIQAQLAQLALCLFRIHYTFRVPTLRFASGSNVSVKETPL